MRLDDRPVLPYQGPDAEKPATRGFPWGMLSLTLGVCAAVGIPIFGFLTRVPGYLQSPILITGGVTGVLAIGSGVGAIFVRAERTRGIIGMCLGFMGLMLMPMLGRA